MESSYQPDYLGPGEDKLLEVDILQFFGLARIRDHERYLREWKEISFLRWRAYVLAKLQVPRLSSGVTKFAEYAFPNDERELDRLDMQHAMQTLLLENKLFWSPMGPSPQKILDLGTGTGIWAIDMAELFPSAQVIGTDLSAIQPDWVPPNCQFEIDDAEYEWTYKPDSFDFIHNRNFICAIRDWPRLIEQTFTHVKPGGWVEWQQKYPLFHSDDGSLAEDSAIATWGRTFFEAGTKFGTSPQSPKYLKRWMKDAGFVDVQEHVVKLPVGQWPKDPRLKKVGLFEMVNMLEGLDALSMMLFTRALKWNPEQVQLFLMDVRKDVKNRAIHSYYHFYVVFGRKPEDTLF